VQWLPIPLRGEPELDQAAIRLNALGSLFFFVGYVLDKHRLREFHRQLCSSLETEDLHAVIEVPMLHFKTTCGNEGLSMWWALPFNAKDEFMMRELGYGDEWIRWMKKAHNQNTRTLITHEVEGLALKMGKAIDNHYQHNDRFRHTFPEIIPTTETWNDHSKYQKRTVNNHTEGTFEYRGVGQSVQSIHIDSIIEDDNVGKDAQKSLNDGDGRVMETAIEYHRIVSTRYDPASFTKTGLGRHLVIGNRWAPKDLNGYIRKNQPEFRIESHSAEGGCCPLHPAGYPLFPEEFDMERLATMRSTLGPFNYSHFFLNQEVMQEECIFKVGWIRHYRYRASNPDLPLDDPTNFLMIEHEVNDGEAVEDFPVGSLHLRMIIDLAHAKKKKRCKHVILIVGLDSETDNLYLLDVWAKAAPYSDLVGNMYKMAEKWGMRTAYLETVAAQNLLKFYFDERNRSDKRKLFIEELAYDNSDNAKKNRIEAMEPVYKNGQFWCHRSHTEFHEEYDTYPASSTIDVLDTLGYVPELFNNIRRKNAYTEMKRRAEEFRDRRVSVTGY
jgi:hypothetical protein